MIHSLAGKLTEKGKDFMIIETGGIGFKVQISEQFSKNLPNLNEAVNCFTFLNIKEDSWSLYGFPDKQSQKLFEFLKTVSGVGPKTAMALTNIDSPENVMSLIIEKRVDLLSKAPGVGKKTAERVVLELHEKLKLHGTKDRAEAMDANLEVEEVLINLGYQRSQVKQALAKLDSAKTVEEKIRMTLRELSKKI